MLRDQVQGRDGRVRHGLPSGPERTACTSVRATNAVERSLTRERSYVDELDWSTVDCILVSQCVSARRETT